MQSIVVEPIYQKIKVKVAYLLTLKEDAMDVHFGLRLLDRASGRASCHNYPGVNQARELRHLQ